MKDGRISNRKIAEKLGISPAALSLVINHKPGVSEQTRERVLDELKRMGREDLVKPVNVSENGNGENKISGAISFVIYKKSGQILDLHPFFLLLMESIETSAAEYGCSVILNTVDCRNNPEAQLRHIRELSPAGAIVFATEMDEEDMKPFMEMPFPVVALDNDLTGISCDTVAIHNEMGTLQAMHYLSLRGLHRVGYLKGRTRISSFRERERGFIHGAQRYGLSLNEKDFYEVRYTEEGSYQEVLAILKDQQGAGARDLPEAFVCDDDTIAIGALRAFREMGIRVPEDISVIGFNDRPGCAFSQPQLTSVNVSRQGLAREAVEELMRLIRRGNPDGAGRCRKIRIGTSLTLRGSVK